MAAPIHSPAIPRHPVPARAGWGSAAPRPTPLVDSVAPFFALAAAPSAPARGSGAVPPQLRVIPGGREAALRRRQPAGVYRRRRLAAGLIVLVVATLIFGAALTAVRALRVDPSLDVGTGPATDVATLSAPVPPVGDPSPGAADVTTITVRPGDTLWSIAARLAPDTDLRPVVDELARRHGGASLEAGERLDVVGIVEG